MFILGYQIFRAWGVRVNAGSSEIERRSAFGLPDRVAVRAAACPVCRPRYDWAAALLRLAHAARDDDHRVEGAVPQAPQERCAAQSEGRLGGRSNRFVVINFPLQVQYWHNDPLSQTR